tara:strand:- start:101 stop:439 length:339 start_codon:yes stop_codon:yes gene_type:complete
MARHDRQTAILPPAPSLKFIPPGRFTEIDAKYYSGEDTQPPQAMFSRGRALTPHSGGGASNKNGFVESTPPLSLETGSLMVNYLSYIYNQQTGWDRAHPRDRPPPMDQPRFH